MKQRTFKIIALTLKFSFIGIFLVSCGLVTTRPKLEMSLARAAFMAAKEAEAEKYSSTNFRKSELYYLKAKSSYRRKYFNKAKTYAELSQKFAEQAEYDSIKKKRFKQE